MANKKKANNNGKNKNNKKESSKSSSLKVLRKQFEKANRLGYGLPALSGSGSASADAGPATTGTLTTSPSPSPTTELDVSSWLATRQQQRKEGGGDNIIENNIENVENGMSTTSISSTPAPAPAFASSPDEGRRLGRRLALRSWSGSELESRSMTGPCLELFRRNMSSLYESSSWGLDLEGKQDELRHRRARFLVLVLLPTTMEENEDEEVEEDGTQQQQQEEEELLVGFCHYRYEYDDDDDPTAVVLYVYEVQIALEYRRLGLGERLMQVVERLASSTTTASSGGGGGGDQFVMIDKVMLTVFKRNESAMRFYVDKLGYEIDETSPSRHGSTSEDYEILSKNIVPP